MSYIRLKSIKKKNGIYEYVYLANCFARKKGTKFWKRGPKQKVKIIGRAYRFGNVENSMNIEGKDKLEDEFLEKADIDEILKFMVRRVLLKKGFVNVSWDNWIFVRDNIYVDLEKLNVYDECGGRRKKDAGIIVEDVEGKTRVICWKTLKDIFKFGDVGNEAEGRCFIRTLFKGGLRPSAEEFFWLVRKKMEKLEKSIIADKDENK